MKMSLEQINKELVGLDGWNLENDSIKKTYQFENFIESIDFINKIAPIAEDMQHHPDIKINYNKVGITLSTHDQGGVTEKDFRLAAKIDKLSA